MPAAAPEEAERLLISTAAAIEERLTGQPNYAPSRGELVFHQVWELEAEVNNGGFLQYFSNSSGHGAPHVPDALRAIGAEHAARIVDAALDVVGRDLPWGNDEARQLSIASLGGALEDALDKLDAQFFCYPDDLRHLLHQFALEHARDLGVPAGS